MSPGNAPGRRAGLGTLAAVCAICAVAPAVAQAARMPANDGLSARLAELAKPAVRSAPPARQARKLGVARSGPGSLVREGNRVLVEARFENGAAAGVRAVRRAGGKVLNVSRRYQTVTVAAKPSQLRRLASLARVEAVREVRAPMVFASTCPQGLAVSEGDEQLRAEEARKEFNLDGSGVTVGVLSDTFDQAKESLQGGPIATTAKKDVENGDLPGAANTCSGQSNPVNVLNEYKPGPGEEEGIDEGRAMLQVVHDLAPGADLSFATAFEGIPAFAENIEELAKAGARVLDDDISYFEEPFFQEGPVGAAIGKVTQEGALYFSSAGNDNLVDSKGRDIGSWETPHFRDAGACPTPLVEVSEAVREEEEELQEKEPEAEFPLLGLNAKHCLDFNPSNGTVDTTYGITVEPEQVLTVDLQWAEPWEGVESDIDEYLFDAKGKLLSVSFEDNVFTSKMPLEILQWENESKEESQTVQLVINRYSGKPSNPNPRLKFALLQNGEGVESVEYPESRGGDVVGPTLYGHSGEADTVSVAAVPFNNSEVPEVYTSHGPVTHYFGPVSGTEPAEPLSVPEVLSKPDLAATDCGQTTFFAFTDSKGKWRFCGTSASGPHAAAVAALAIQWAEGPEGPGEAPSPQALRQAEVNSARPVGEFGSCLVGGGLVDAVKTIEALKSGEPGPAPPPCEPPLSPPVPEPPVQHVNPGPELGAPNTFFRKRPRAVVRTHKRRARVVFRFGSDQSGVSFLCKVDRGGFRACAAKLVRRFGPGKHVVKVKAVGPGGTDKSPAVWPFFVRRVRQH